MSVYRRLLLMWALSNRGLVISFKNGVARLNTKGNGNKITVDNGVVTLLSE